MAAVVAGALVGCTIAAYALHRLLGHLRRRRSGAVAPAPPSASEQDQEAEVGEQNASANVASSSTLKEPSHPARKSGEEVDEHRPNPRRSLLAQFDEPQALSLKEDADLKTEIKPVTQLVPETTLSTNSAGSESLEVKLRKLAHTSESVALDAKPNTASKFPCANSAETKSKPADITQSEDTSSGPAADSLSPPVQTTLSPQPATPKPQNEEKPEAVAKPVLSPQPATPKPQDEEEPVAKPVTPIARSGVKLPPGAVSVMFPSPVTLDKLSTGAVPAYSATHDTKKAVDSSSPPAKPPRLYPGIISLDKSPSAPRPKIRQLAKEDTTSAEALPPISPKLRSTNKPDHTSPHNTPSGSRVPSSAVQVLPSPEAPYGKDSNGDGLRDTARPSDLDGSAQSNGIHSNRILTGGAENLETATSFDQPVSAPQLKVPTRNKGPDRRLPTKHQF